VRTSHSPSTATLLALALLTSEARAEDAGELGDDAALHRERAIECMTLAVAYEAGLEPLVGRQAVAEVILNRANHPAYPRSICGVVFQGAERRTGCQFTFTCDGSLRRYRPRPKVLAEARAVAAAAIEGLAKPLLSGATHYHASYVSPYWAPSLVRLSQIGAHIFYRLPANSDMMGRQRYVPRPEPDILSTRAWSPEGLAARSALPGVPAASTAGTFAPWGLATNN
jgi:Cell Wall Hydrolase